MAGTDGERKRGIIADVRSSFYLIQVEGEQSRPEFTSREWTSDDGAPPRKGDEVTFALADRRGRKAFQVKLLRRAETSTPPPSSADKIDEAPPTPGRPPRRDRASGFLNPYNFVRPIARTHLRGTDSPDVRLLGRCLPPPHDRYVGLTGTLTCTLTAHSPVFVSDSYAVTEHPKVSGHKSYRFFRDASGEPCIPGSSLRGVVRSVFEAATNSCWEHVAGGRRLSHRIGARDARRLVPARLVRTGEKWKVELLTGTTGYLPDGPSGGRLLYAAWVLRYPRAPAPGTDGQGNGYRQRSAPKVAGGLKHGDPCVARLRSCEYQNGTLRFRFWNVEAIGREEEVGVPGRDPDVYAGWYFCNGRNIDRKHDERFFFAARPDSVLVETECVERYVELLMDYRDRHAREGAGREPDAQGIVPSRFIEADAPEKVEECHGELVYVWIEGRGDERVVQSLGPVSVPRLMYNQTVEGRFPNIGAVRSCSHENRKSGGDAAVLCPACRTFGWVRSGEKGTGERGAYRSRVRFGDAPLRDADLVKKAHVLEILSSPKPTTVRFYLMRKDGDLGTPEPRETAVDWNSEDVVVRGRKFYRRRKDARLGGASESGQNRTLRDHLEAGSTATFTVHFQNLAPVELGALLWALELEPEWVHRLGFGKPLGLGSVRMSVDSVSLLRPDRYTAGTRFDSREKDAARPLVEALKERFRAALVERYGDGAHDSSFDTLVNVADMRGLLGSDPELPVEYPMLPGAAESFHWFVTNRRGKRFQGRDGLGHWLDLAAGDRGLPRDPTRP